MITLEDALTSLKPNAEWTLEDNSNASTLIWNDTTQTQPTDAEITAEQTRLQAEYDSLAYARSRKQEYDKLNQWEMQFDDNRDGTTTWVDSINEIKVRFPK
jgi:hypothetical protein